MAGNKKKSTQVGFNPGSNKISRKDYIADCTSPGAVTLILQMTTPCLLFQDKDACNLKVLGGTFVSCSPTVFPFMHVLIPALSEMGAKICLEVGKPGYFPDIVGEVTATIQSLEPGESLKAITLLERKGSYVVEVFANASTSEGLDFYESTFKGNLVKALSEGGVKEE